MNRSVLQFLQMLLVLLDLTALNVICFLSRWDLPNDHTLAQSVAYFHYFLLCNGLWVITASIGGVYARKVIASSRRFMQATEWMYIVWASMAAIYAYVLQPSGTLKAFTVHMVLYFAVGLLVNRLIYRLIRKNIRTSATMRTKVLILGYTAFSAKLASILEKEDFSVNVVGFIADGHGRNENLTNHPVYEGVETSVAICRKLRADEILSTLMPQEHSVVYDLMQQAEKALIRFRLVPNFARLVNTPVHVDYLRSIPVLNPRREPLENAFNQLRKRIFDIVVSLLAIVFVISWLVPLLGILIYFDSPGPIFFVQLRSGKNNKPFGCFKFRSMRMNSEANQQSARRNDSRFTRIGQFIRKTSLDEFPQFFNVLKGDMSVIGPRPHMLRHTSNFSEIEEHYMVRQLLKPGISGWAQVNGARGEVTHPEDIRKRVKYDLWYLENWNLWLDMRIVFMTVANIFKGEKNAF